MAKEYSKEYEVKLTVKVADYATIEDFQRELDMFNSANKDLIEVETVEISQLLPANASSLSPPPQGKARRWAG